MGFLSNSHQYTAVTSIINDCCKQNEPNGDDYYIETQLSSLLDAIKNQKDYVEPGPIEAARALRKKLKYGDLQDQYNALKILDLLIVNGGKGITSMCNDDKLLNMLQYYLNPSSVSSSWDSSSNVNSQGPNKKIAKLARTLMSSWYDEFYDDSRIKNINKLYERNMKAKKSSKKKSRSYASEVPDFMNDEADMDYTPFDDDAYDDTYSTSSKNKPKTNAELDKKFKIPKINYEREGPKIMQLIAEANILATNLLNILSGLGNEELSIHSIKANDAFDSCRAVRRKVLRYLQLVNKEELLGPLLKCNDDLVVALKKYEEQSVPPEARVREGNDTDSDSDYDSLQDYESDNEPVNPPVQSSSRRTNNRYDDDNSDGYGDSDDDSFYSRDRLPRGDPPTRVSQTSSSSSSSSFKKKAPPPVPTKRSFLRSPKADKTNSQRSKKDDFDPFSDENEVAPVTWG